MTNTNDLRPVCGFCGFPIHEAEAREYRGDHCTHHRSRCTQLIHDALDALKAENERLRERLMSLADRWDGNGYYSMAYQLRAALEGEDNG